MAQYDKHLWKEFVYTAGDGDTTSMEYTGVAKAYGAECVICGKVLTNGHCFTGTKYGEEWIFGSECVKTIFKSEVIK